MNIPKCSTCRRWKKEYWCITCNYEAKDLVEVVRCKDCKHNCNTCFNHGGNEPICDFTDRKMKETDFCSFGERRAER